MMNQQRVVLYSLKDDATESNNLSFKSEYRPKVDKLMTRLTKLLKREFESGEIEADQSLDRLGPQI